jgi:hypothetical protein
MQIVSAGPKGHQKECERGNKTQCCPAQHYWLPASLLNPEDDFTGFRASECDIPL